MVICRVIGLKYYSWQIPHPQEGYSSQLTHFRWCCLKRSILALAETLGVYLAQSPMWFRWPPVSLTIRPSWTSGCWAVLVHALWRSWENRYSSGCPSFLGRKPEGEMESEKCKPNIYTPFFHFRESDASVFQPKKRKPSSRSLSVL